VACDDANDCTTDTQCDATGNCTGGTSTCDCVTTADCLPYEDGDACNGTLVCNTANVCALDTSTVVTCDTSGDTICRRNVCDPGTGACNMTNQPDGGWCDDGEFCTSGDQCTAGACIGATPTCPLVGCVTGCNSTTRTCTVAVPGTVCRAATDDCDAPETCDGATATCPTDVPAAAGTVCRPAAGGCDSSEACDGSSTSCPADVRLRAGTVCRPATLPCDVPESCDGFSAACPDETWAASGVLCRASTGPCDPAEFCTGAQPDCVIDAFLPAGAACEDGNPCSVGDICLTDHTCRPGGTAPPPMPTAIAPLNGALTGSLHATLGTVNPLRPAFRWVYTDDGCGAVDFTVELTASCTTPGFSSCTFATGVTTLRATATQRVAVPATALAVSTLVPVGQRYYWRMRACRVTTTNCSAWTAVRYLDVGRAPGDFNGDGYSDVAVGEPLWAADDRGAIRVWHGRTTAIPGNPTATLNPGAASTQAGARFGAALALAGDINADGFADLVAGSPAYDAGGNTDQGRAFLFYGAASGLPTEPTVTLNHPETQAGASFGAAMAGVDDLNADGYADLVVGAPGHTGSVAGQGRAYVYLGRSGSISSASAINVTYDTAEAARFGDALTGAGDLDGDGSGDFAVGAPASGGAARIGRVRVFTGQIGMTPFRERWTLDSPRPTEAGGRFGLALAGGGDLDGDGFSDLAVGSTHDDPSTDSGVAYLFFGSPTGYSLPASVKTTRSGVLAISARFSEALAVDGDANADGIDDLFVGAPGQSDLVSGSPEDGGAYFFPGNVSRLFTAPVAYPNPYSTLGGDLWGGAVGWLGDIQGDGLDDAGVGAESMSAPEVDEGNFWWFLGAVTGLSTSGTRIDNPSGEAGNLFGAAIAQP
jgi:hypothetical protein